MYPHERSLVKRLAGKPFVLLGINSDPDRQELKEIIKKEDLPWRSWWDGGSTAGPISTKWQVSNWPTLYVLDDDGVIRHKALANPGDDTLDKWIDDLVAEAEKTGAKDKATK
jgi:hypothetical protein